MIGTWAATAMLKAPFLNGSSFVKSLFLVPSGNSQIFVCKEREDSYQYTNIFLLLSLITCTSYYQALFGATEDFMALYP